MFLLVLGRLLILLRPNSLRPNFLTPQPRFEFHFRRRVSIGRRQESAGNMTRQDAPDCRHAIRTPYYLQQGREIEGPEAPERPTGRIQLRIRVCGLSVNQLGLAPFAINPCLIWGYVNTVGCTGCAKARNFHRQYATSSAGLSPSACYVRIPPPWVPGDFPIGLYPVRGSPLGIRGGTEGSCIIVAASRPPLVLRDKGNRKESLFPTIAASLGDGCRGPISPFRPREGKVAVKLFRL